MRKIYSLIALAVLMMTSLTAKAAVAAETLTSNLETVASYFEGYGVYHYYNFKTMARDGGESQAFTIASDPIDALMPITTPDFEIFSVAIGRGTAANPDLRYRDSSYGLYEFGSGARTFRISSLKAGMIFVLQGAQGQSYDYFANGVINADEAEEITSEITDKMNEGLEEGAEPVANPYRYFRILKDGKFDFSVNRGCYLLSAAILIDQSAGEAVSAPSLKVVGVDGPSRNLEFKTGESTLGTTVHTYYSIDGSDPVFLKETDEVETWDYVYDEEGNVIDQTPLTYKKVLDLDAFAEYGTYGETEYIPGDGPFQIQGDDDEDGDGFVELKTASVSENGIMSEIVSIMVSVGTIKLNDPTLTLSGIDGLSRQYTIGWNNNTICGESYMFKIETSDGSYYNELEPNTGIGYSFKTESDPKVTVIVDGYDEGVCEQTAYLSGIEVKRKNTNFTADLPHDWNFTVLSEYQYALITQNPSLPEVIENCYIETPAEEEGAEPTRTYYTAEEFLAGVANDGTDLADAIAVCKPSGWYETIANNRTTLNVIEGGDDQNENGMGYAKDELGLFDGINLSCPPNSGNNSCIFKYIGKDDWAGEGYNGDGITTLGVYFMSRPTLTFPRETVAAGEIVTIYYGQGGSNYTNTRTLGVYEAPVDAPLSVQLPNGGVHVFYIDVYTYDNLPTDEYDPEAVGIVSAPAQAAKSPAAYYSVNGAKLSAPQKGINIVKFSDGSVKKILVK